MDNWAAVVGLAQQQHGVVSREQYQALFGLDGVRLTAAVQWAVKARRLERVHRGVYRLPGTAPSWHQRASIALLAAGPGSALSHASAGALYRLDGLSRTPSPLDVSVPDRACATVPVGVRLHRPSWPFATLRREGLPVTLVTRTLVDLGSVLQEEPLELALDSAQRRFPRLGAWLADEFAQLSTRGRPGMKTLKALWRERDGQRSDSPLELPTWRRLRARGLRPRLQHKLYAGEGRYIMRLDFAWLAERFALHVDSFEWHTSRAAWDRDLDQRNRLHALGWSDMVITKPMLASDEWLDELVRRLAERNPQGTFAFPQVG